jgi:hypothetical protein
MSGKRPSLLVGLVLGVALFAGAPARAEGPRKLLWPSEVKGPLAAVVARLTCSKQPAVADRDLKSSRYFLRIVPRDLVLDGASLRKGAWIGGRPFAFLTAPESLYGKPLLQVYGDIGYSAEQVLDQQLGRPVVALVFRYPDDVCLHTGKLPADWSRRVYAPTWATTFALFERLAAEAEIDKGDKRPFMPGKLLLRSERERGFIASFPKVGKKRLARAPYQSLQAVGGSDWEYRSLLERNLGMNEHFTGTGRTRPGIGRDKKDRLGLPEWLGPNLPLDKLPELAIVDLGALRIAK